ncbi:ImmA/IrrE family metallo-endopeptidase [bacterium]|nr:ImmA/IrrE family metallo-endopeptidase [bacterium]MBU1633304.1 ImmA/IrrE family metallo-endopeptidase [bacterium]MBU1873399.1 ImmA/IrrE family metallo-endopeptidase [bacterium]
MDIKVKCLSWEQIRLIADDFREQHVKPSDLLPVDMEMILEIELKIDIDLKENLLALADIDAFISPDCRTMFVDKNQYEDRRYLNRLRFTYAHEVGHIVLHKEEMSKIRFSSIEEWIQFQTNRANDGYIWFERQANEFAGRLLIPKPRLLQEIKNYDSKIKQYLSRVENDCYELDSLKMVIARAVCPVFGVSEKVLYRRIVNEKIFEEIGY